MSYDSPDFRVQMMAGPIKGSFSAFLFTVANGSCETHTAEDDADKIEFFRNIKLLDFKVMPIIAPIAGNAVADTVVKYKLFVGTDVVATATALGSSTDKGQMIEGGIASGTLAEVTSNEEVKLQMVYTAGDTTDTTFVTHTCNAYVLYEHRFA